MKTSVLITGGGLNGCTLALALSQAGIATVLVDASRPDDLRRNDFDGRSYAISAASSRMLRTLGLWDGLDANAQPMFDIKVTDGQVGQGPGNFFMHFDHAELGGGPMGYIVEDRHLRQSLLAAIEAGDLTYLPETTVTDQRVEDGYVFATLHDGTVVQSQILVGADGRGSGTATRAGLKRMGWGYDQTSLVCAVDHALPHNGVAHQFFMPSGPLAILPLVGNRSSIVWTEKTETALAINALDDAGYMDVLRPRFGDFLGEITLTGARYTYPLGLVLAHSLVADRVALVGDAAHGVHPIAGQGLNAGMKDVAALAQVLVETHRLGLDLGAGTVLDEYQRWRRFDNTTLALATDGFNRLFSNTSGPLRGLRDVGMGVVNALPSLRRGFMKEAAGLTGELPKLMQGQPL